MSNSTSSSPTAIRVAARSGLPQAAMQGVFQLLPHEQAVVTGRRPSVVPRMPCPEDYRMSRADLVAKIHSLQAKGSLPNPYPLAVGKVDKLPVFVSREAIEGEPGFLQGLVSGFKSFYLGPAGAMASPIETDSADQVCTTSAGTLQGFLDDIDASTFYVVAKPAPGPSQTRLGLGEVRVLIRLNGSGGAGAQEALRLLARHFAPSSHIQLRVSCLAGMPELPGEWTAEELCDPALASELRAHDASWNAISTEFDALARRLGLIEPGTSLANMGPRELKNLVGPWRYNDHNTDGPTDLRLDEREQFAESVTVRANEHMVERDAILKKMGRVLYTRLQEPAKTGTAQVDIIGMDDSNAMDMDYLELYGQGDRIVLHEHEKF